MDGTPPVGLSWIARWKLACRVLLQPSLAAQVAALGSAPGPSGSSLTPRGHPGTPVGSASPPAPPAPERVHASGLALLAALQREGRLVDFLQQEVAAFSDEEVGAAARVVHAGCRRVLQQSIELVPAVPEAEGAAIHLPVGFDAQRVRLTGNVAGQPPFHGTVKHHGWVASSVRFPALSESLDPRVVAAAEVELG